MRLAWGGLCPLLMLWPLASQAGLQPARPVPCVAASAGPGGRTSDCVAPARRPPVVRPPAAAPARRTASEACLRLQARLQTEEFTATELAEMREECRK